jgi:serine/threonine protein kinase HipA of HipAB toxin-antitoxin module
MTPITTLTVQTPTPTIEPRGARVAVAAVLALRDAWASLRRGLAQRRAYSRRVAEANELRAIARAMDRHDPRVACEMRAAADRHELG